MPKFMVSREVAHRSSAHSSLANIDHRVLPNHGGSVIIVLPCVQGLRAPSDSEPCQSLPHKLISWVVRRLK